MLRINKIIVFITCTLFAGMILLSSCSNKKNTSFSRFYHSVNTRYNVHFNADEAFKESMQSKQKSQDADDNLSQILHVYPLILDSGDLKYKGSFTTTIDKTTKAIKLHSIKTKPRRDPSKRNDPKYQAWIQRLEFNPYLINSWMLLGKSEFEEGNYLRAITTFMYITKIYSTDKRIVSESKLWIARSYSEMGWMYEAENVLRKMEQNNEIHHQLLGMYSSIKANIYVHNKNYESAIPYLEEAIKKEKGFQKRRNKYLLAQLYQATGNNEKAYLAYKNVRSFSAPYHYTINSRLNELEVAPLSDQKRISTLKGMTKPLRNKEYLDQIYTSLANVYLKAQDTVQAIENYELAIEHSERNAYDKAVAQIKLGGLYFETQKYVQAQPHYSGALPQLKKADEKYAEVSLRSEVLDQLVVHAKVVNEQDSLLRIANMPDFERTAYIEAHIEKVKKEEAKKKKEEELAKLEDDRNQPQINEPISWDNIGKISPNLPPVTQTTPESDFYFYSKQAVDQGKISFQKKWGKRPLEDNWRRKSKKTTNPFGEEELIEELAESDSIVSPMEGGDMHKAAEVTDIYSVEYYLQQLPLTDQEKQESEKLIENGLFNMGLIYKNLLEDKQLAIATFEEDLTRFPDTPNREEIYFQLFLIYLQMGKEDFVGTYRNKIINEFPESKYTIPLSDENYAWNFTYMAKMQEELYQATYEAYLKGDYITVRRNHEEIQTKLPFVDLMPKFSFLNSLSYAQTKDAKRMEVELTKLITDYPQADVVPLATSILKNIKDGKIILSDGTPLSGMDWTMAYSNDSIFEGEAAKVLEYRTDLDKPYVLLLMFKPKTIDRNDLLYEVADYNFSNYVIQTYDLRFDDNPILSALEINGFKDFKAIQSYINKAVGDDGLLSHLEKDITPVPISTDNYRDIYPRLGLETYMTFYSDSLSSQTPQLMKYWGQDIEASPSKTKEEVSESKPELVDKGVKVEVEEQEPIVLEKVEDVKPPIKEPIKVQEKENDKEVNLEDVLTEDQVKLIGDIDKKTDDLVESISNLGSNPVEGLKNIFNRNKIEDNLTKEEKEELKQQRKAEKERQKEERRILKAQQDSIAQVNKLKLDSISQLEKAREDSIQNIAKQEKALIEFERKEKERIAKEQVEAKKREQQDRERERRDMLKERENQRKQQEQERKEKLRQREKERRDLQQKREQERKDKEKAAEELRKQREREREEKLKQREQELKERRSR